MHHSNKWKSQVTDFSASPLHGVDLWSFTFLQGNIFSSNWGKLLPDFLLISTLMRIWDAYNSHGLPSKHPHAVRPFNKVVGKRHAWKVPRHGQVPARTLIKTRCHTPTHASGCCSAVFMALICWKWQDMSVAITISMTKVRNSLPETPHGEKGMKVKHGK